MYIFDTNVISELMRDTPDPAVVAWSLTCPVEAMFTTTISQTEILFGCRRLPEGERRRRLIGASRALFGRTFAGRILAFDGAAASACADIRVERERVGRPIHAEDGMIAAIGRSTGAVIVTRDLQDFAGCGLTLINPWLDHARD